jgi:hypothetical protein
MDGGSSPATNPVMEVSKHRVTCRACGKLGMKPVLDLGNQYLPRFVAEVDETLPRVNLSMVQCSSCGLLQLDETTNPDLLYREFWYRSSVNQTMRDALNDLVLDGLTRHQGGVWLDIGANDGYLLSRVPPEFQRVAVEPAENMKHLLEEHSDLVITDYFKATGKIKGSCDIITSAAMFYDLDDPGKFLDDIVASLHPRGVWINQLNDSPAMMKQNAFDSICHEHLCYYDVPVLDKMYRDHGLEIIGISHNSVNGHSVRLTAQRIKGGKSQKTDLSGIDRITPTAAQAFAERINRWKARMNAILDLYPDKLWCYGASTKGTVLLQYLDRADRFEAVADRNHVKFGLRMAGSWLPIVPEEKLREAKPSMVLILPWAFHDEFNDREAKLRATGTAMLYPLPNIELVV